jgi:hypothetical protein
MHPLGFNVPTKSVKYDTECSSCCQTFNMNDCILLTSGYYLCEDCYEFCRRDLYDDDILEVPAFMDNPLDEMDGKF